MHPLGIAVCVCECVYVCMRMRKHVYTPPHSTARGPWISPCVSACVFVCVRESMCLPSAPHSTARAPWALPCVPVSVYICVCVRVSTWRHIARHGPLGHRLAPADAHFETKNFYTSHGHFGTISIHPVHHIHKSAIALPIDLLLRGMQCVAARCSVLQCVAV